MKNEAKSAKYIHGKRQFSYDKLESYHLQYMDENTNRFSDKYLELRACPVCNSNEHEFLFDKSGGTYVKCKSCTMVFTNPVFTEAALNEYYTNLDTGQAQIVEEDSDFYREIYTLGLDSIFKFINKGAILDIGCSSGFFLDIAKEKGLSTLGIELGVAEAELCEKRGHTVFTRPVEEVKFKEQIDVITLWDVFEHIPSPNKYLQSLSKILSDKGVIFMQIPSSGSLAAKIMRDKTKMFDGVEHVNLYNPSTIKKTVEVNGFEIVSMKSVISERSVINNYLSFNDPYTGDSEYGSKVLDIMSEELIHENLLGYKMQIILKKN